MKRECYVIEAENGVGLYLSEKRIEQSWKYLVNRQRSKLKFDDFKSAKSYIFSKYRGDDEIDLTQFEINKTIFRDVSNRFNFFVQSKDYIGYGIHIGSYAQFIRLPQVSRNDIIEVDNTREAEEFARSGFADEYGRPEYYYTGPMRPGESISFAEMLRYNQIDTRRVDMLPKLNGNDIMPANIMPGESRQSLYYRQIGKLDISDLEKARLNVVAQNAGKEYVGENDICKISCSASFSDFELLASVGLAEKGVRFVCKECGEPCAVISAKDLEIYKRTWQLLELKSPTDAEISEFVNLCERGYRYFQMSCNNKDCNAQQDVIITDMAELREHRNESETVYKIHDAIV